MTESRTALLLLDFQVGLGDQSWARDAVANAHIALTAARNEGLLVVFSKVAFEPGYVDVAPSSKAFWPNREKDALAPEASLLIDEFAPTAGEALVDKNRFNPFAGSKLSSILRSQLVTHVVLAGVSTSGVVLGAFTEAETHDLHMTVLSDACADPNPGVHHALTETVFPRSANVQTTTRWTGT
ncbi:hypothetical protein MMAD_18170 [Mycolicibacterium madagascariense]|uniref:Isochorismatase-like domain-containing protein n=1 Tax=Mycolicibacterium madagascariense TaxID=212765 RepID=A0A7I7XDH0_9MYCO|nr:cysteine hydrolase [Mycolicibacterium madagascariense]MCV7015229.1 cysteine hydrolase [Mycolicibacterium madagascariense]BBZ27522.1 hypothetical protein MMAD_18170 [Mycolicibacterium madagascariense]